eukprot:TRINITY_DN38154_c0_g2_i1.p2 TRINITY_DN38154_c0_g2~~TRINITY_DN38154_c0_g2_i1.p2  ORF type:complete len:109 (-),score=3.57 TRINITY_DN38154_c0_g2_i1:109-414(-)
MGNGINLNSIESTLQFLPRLRSTSPHNYAEACSSGSEVFASGAHKLTQYSSDDGFGRQTPTLLLQASAGFKRHSRQALLPSRNSDADLTRYSKQAPLPAQS